MKEIWASLVFGYFLPKGSRILQHVLDVLADECDEHGAKVVECSTTYPSGRGRPVTAVSLCSRQCFASSEDAARWAEELRNHSAVVLPCREYAARPISRSPAGYQDDVHAKLPKMIIPQK
jgi:hypothetical protein